MTTYFAWAIYYIAIMILPVLYIYLGFVRMTKQLPFGRLPGYCSELSTVSEQTWAHAQRVCGLRYIIVGLLLAAGSIWFSMIMPATKTIQLFVCGLILISAQFMVQMFLIATVESSLRRNAAHA